MIKLSTLAKLKKNELYSDTAFIVLLQIEMVNDKTNHIFIAINTEDVNWNNKIWQAFPCNFGEVKEDGSGSIPSFELNIDNTGRALEYWLNKGGGGINSTITLYVVLSTALTNPVAEVEEEYSVTDVKANENYVTFTLGNSYSAQTRRPFDVYKKDNCPYRYKSVECGAISNFISCNHTLSDCRKRDNSPRFGGFPGIDTGGLYI